MRKPKPVTAEDLRYFLAYHRQRAAQLRASEEPAKAQFAAAIEARMNEYERGERQLVPLPPLQKLVNNYQMTSIVYPLENAQP